MLKFPCKLLDNKPTPLAKAERSSVAPQEQACCTDNPAVDADTDAAVHEDADADPDLGTDLTPTEYEPRWQPRPPPLLTKLSSELRLMIWERVLGGSRLHIIQRPGRRLAHIICPDALLCDICQDGLPQPVKDGCRSLPLTPTWSDKSRNSKKRSLDRSKTGGSRLLALPMTCRKM